MKQLDLITGKVSKGDNTCFQATGSVSHSFYGFTPVGGDCEFSQFQTRATTYSTTTAIKSQWNTSGTFYQGVYYPISGVSATLSTGEALFYYGG